MSPPRPFSPKSSQEADEALGSSSSVLSHLSFFRSSLLNLPEEILDHIAMPLKFEELIQLAQTNKAAYLAFYPTIKAAMIKTLNGL